MLLCWISPPLSKRKTKSLRSFGRVYKLDSISGHWDYIEPALFGFAAGKAIESFTRFYDLEEQKIVSQFHEWQTGGGLLYLEKYLPTVGTVFTTHATTVGRSIAGNNQSLYSQLDQLNGDLKARELNVVAKHSLEKLAGTHADTFTTVSELTARECKQFHNREVDVVLPNGFEDSFVPDESEFGELRKKARKLMIKVASALTGDKLPEDTVLDGHQWSLRIQKQRN